MRVILRNLGGKSCWDASVLYARRDALTPSRRQSLHATTAAAAALGRSVALAAAAARDEQLLTSSFVGSSAVRSIFTYFYKKTIF